jgi:hypothetical protein
MARVAECSDQCKAALQRKIMTYTPDVPVTGQTLGNSKPLINSNFMLIPQLIAVNHISFGQPGVGKHNLVSFYSQGSDQATGATDVAAYSKTAGGNTQLYFRAPSSGAVYQWTGTAAAASSTPSANANGWTYLAGGILLMWFNVTIAGSLTPFNYSAFGLPNFPTAAFGGWGSCKNSAAAVSVNAAQTSVTIASSNGSQPGTIFVIGN